MNNVSFVHDKLPSGGRTAGWVNLDQGQIEMLASVAEAGKKIRYTTKKVTYEIIPIFKLCHLVVYVGAANGK